MTAVQLDLFDQPSAIPEEKLAPAPISPPPELETPDQAVARLSARFQEDDPACLDWLFPSEKA
jgi:hypothetical protein